MQGKTLLRELLGFIVGVAIVGVSWYLVFFHGFGYGTYSLILAPIIAGLIARRTGSGLVIGFLVNLLLGVAIGAIILRDLSQVPIGSLQSVIGLFGLLGAAIIGVVGGVIGAVGGAFGGFVGGHLTPKPKIMLPSAMASQSPPNLNRVCPKCMSPVRTGIKFCEKCGAPL